MSPVSGRISGLNHRGCNRKIFRRAEVLAPGLRLWTVRDRKRVPQLDERVAERVEHGGQESFVAVATHHRR